MSTYTWIKSAAAHAARFGEYKISRSAYEGPGLYNKRTGYQMDQPQRTEVCAPQVIRDGMPTIKCMVDGRRYDSKRAYYAAVKLGGTEDRRNGYKDRCQIVAGESAKRYVTPQRSDRAHMRDVARDVKRSIAELRSR
jgi:hypothetical protein